MQNYIKKSQMPVPADRLFAWHENPCAIERLTPPWNNVKVIRKDIGLNPGSEVHLKTYIGPIPVTWVARHTSYQPGKEFSDIQVKGPFARWLHHHRMIPKNKEQSFLEDEVQYQMYAGLGNVIAKRSIEQLFHYRHTILRQDFEVQNSFPTPRMTIAITGGSGLIGLELSTFLRSAGHKVISIVRKKTKENEILWNINSGQIEQEKLEGIDAVIHLAGENISSGRWTKEKKKNIEESRVNSTKLLVKALNTLRKPPKVFISTSAIGYYGGNNTTPPAEEAPAGHNFLADVCKKWESAARGFKRGRLVIPRLGVVLSPKGGMLNKMLLPFKIGLGGKVGPGQQLISWISIDDLIYHFYRVLLTPSIEGPVNMCSPQMVSNLYFSRILASTLNRPCFFSIPTFIIKLLFGKMGEEAILSNSGAEPAKLQNAAFPFYHPDLSSALTHLLGKSP